ncbi:MAG TPA: LEA type 2 family protein [Vicinamibacterales bacterium]|nr:LEA type 2 family protein [Vicinamibacterales bacterium]
MERRQTTRRMSQFGTALTVALLCSTGCATLQELRALVQAPRFEEAEGQRAEIRIVGPAADRPLGGAAVRIWTKVTNPNPFGVTLGTLSGTLFLDDARAASADFPLGLPLGAGQESVVPIDLSISFADLPGLATTLRRGGQVDGIPYSLNGTIGVDAGRLGQPVFGPMTLVRGELRVR